MTYMDIILPPSHSWTAIDWDMYRFFRKLGVKVKATTHNGYAYVVLYNAIKPSRSMIIKQKM